MVKECPRQQKPRGRSVPSRSAQDWRSHEQALCPVWVCMWCVCMCLVLWVDPGISLLPAVCPGSTTHVGGACQHLCWQPLEGRDCAPLISASPGGTKEVLGTWWVEIKRCWFPPNHAAGIRGYLWQWMPPAPIPPPASAAPCFSMWLASDSHRSESRYVWRAGALACTHVLTTGSLKHI